MMSHRLCRRSVASILLTGCVPGWCLVATLTAAALTAAPRTDARAQARERTMYVSALDKNKAPVKSLQPNDIVIREDGMAREILRIVPATDPLQIALLIDNSQAATQRIQRMRDALSAFINKVANGKHEIAIVTLADRPTLKVDATTNAKMLLDKGANTLFAQPGAGMYLLEAILDASKGFKKREATRPVMLAVITEGTEFSQSHYETVIDALKSTGTAFYAVVLAEGPEADPALDETRNRNIVLDRGTRETGGRRETLVTDMALGDELQSIANDLLHQFKVTYARPETLIPPKQVTVEAKAADLTARGTLSGPRDTRGSK
jgi:VWFA-related protein